MYILAIETTGALGSVALLDIESGATIGYESSADGMNHLRDLIPMIDCMVKKAGIKKSEIQYVASSIGPGSFTGIRIGVASARALAQTLGLSCVAVPTLSAFMAKESAAKETAEGKVVCAILNARRGQVYGMLEGQMPDGPYMLSDVLATINEKLVPAGKKVVFYGDGVDAYKAKIAEALGEEGTLYEFADESVRYQDAKSVAALAKEYIEQGKTVSFAELLPDYMRLAEAEQKLKNGELAISKMKQE